METVKLIQNNKVIKNAIIVFLGIGVGGVGLIFAIAWYA